VSRALCDTTANHSAADRAYVDAHRFLYGDLGEHVATAAILFRDRLMRPGFVLPVIRLAPVAPYGKCMALSGNSSSLGHVPDLDRGIWLYLHQQFFGSGAALLDRADATVLHELLHNELVQFDQNPGHKGEPWARRCQELSTRLGIEVRIERPRSRRFGSGITTDTPPGCLPYADLVRWPQSVLNGGPPLRIRAAAEPALCAATVNHCQVINLGGEAGRLAAAEAEAAGRLVYIGNWQRQGRLRTWPKSIWANPFKVKDYGREEAIRRYRAWLLRQPALLARLHELRSKVLGCWCHPERCHGDVLAELAGALP
jgi:hypothetical protein